MKNRAELASYFAERGFDEGAEIGVLGGGYSVTLCEANPKLRLHCIDTWGLDGGKKEAYHKRKYKEAKLRLKPYNARLIRKYSLDAIGEFKRNSLGFVYIDASHNFDNVVNDIIQWTPIVKKGGIVSGDDYNTSLGVKLAVDAYTKAHDYNLQLTTSVDYRGSISWYFTKKWNS